MTIQQNHRVISLTELQMIVPLSRSQIWRLEQTGELPRRVRIGRRRVGWFEAEILDWLRLRGSVRSTQSNESDELSEAESV